MVPLWEIGREPKGPGRAALLRELRARLSATEGLAGGIFRPWTGLLTTPGCLYLTGAVRPSRDRRWMELLSWEERFFLARAIVQAVELFERHAMRAGSIRPENLVRSGDGFALCDPLVDELLLPHRPGWALFHSLNFAAPEVLRGGAPSQAGDRFALGATLYWVFTGRLPFDRADPCRIPESILSEIPVDPRYFTPVLPERATAAISALLAEEPAGRPAPGVLVDSFRSEKADPSQQRAWCLLRSKPPPRKRRKLPVSWRRRLLPAAAGLAAAALAAAAFWPRAGQRSPLPPLREAARIAGGFYQARNSGDAWAVASFLAPGARLPAPPEGASALWFTTGPVQVRRGGNPGRALATLDVEEAAFIRGRIRRWSGREVLEMKAGRDGWRIISVRRSDN